uniref:Uncharacterized protein n=1 Tax=viral metagenome TaxID=1070528 RepID=A0A6C0EH53_9ZZZZ
MTFIIYYSLENINFKHIIYIFFFIIVIFQFFHNN